MDPTVRHVIVILHDVLAMTCMTALLATARGMRERRRALTAAVYVLAAATALLNSMLFTKTLAETDYDTAVLIFGCISLVTVLVFPQIILRSSRRLSSALICLAVNVGMEGLFSVVGYLFGSTDPTVYLMYESVFCAAGYALVTLFLLLASKNRDLKIIRSTVELIPKWMYVIIILCSFYSYFSVMGREPGLYDFAFVSGVLRALAVLGVILFAGYFVFQVFSLMAKQNQVLWQLNTQQLNYERLLKSDEQLRQFRHDYKNHMLVVTSLLNAGLTEEAAKYLEQIKGDSGLAEKRFLTGNIAVDAILNNKVALAEEYGIEFSFSGPVPQTGIEAADLCTVVGNITDNAIESTRSYPGDRYIRIRSSVRNGYLTISETNPVAQKVLIKNNRIKTSKDDTANHGIGLKNVAAAAKKYNGGMALHCSDTEFTADVTMRLNENPHNTKEDVTT